VNLERHLKLDKKACDSPNLCDRFSEKDLQTIGGMVYEGYMYDKASRHSWEQRVQAALDLALQLQEDKTFPWPGAANVKFPLVTIAALQWHARAYPALVPSNNVVQMRVVGADPDGKRLQKSLRIGSFMSYQLMEESDHWEAEHDRLLLSIPIVGCAFKKTFRDGTRGENRSEMVAARDLYINYWAKSVEDCPRKTHRIPMQKNEMYSRMAGGIYRDCREEGWYESGAQLIVDKARENIRTGMQPINHDDTTPYFVLEQHVRLDLDGDGYDEPYIVTIDEASQATVRIVTAFDYEDIQFIGKEIVDIPATEYFTKYGFIPSPDGGIYDIGYGLILGPLNETASSIVNQIIDAATMQIRSGGFLGRGAKIKGGNQAFNPFQWNPVDSTGDELQKSIMPLPVRDISPVLFQLLNLVIDYTNRITGATDIMVGENPGQNTPAQTSQTMVAQGEKISADIFKRTWRSMKQEFQKLYRLNKRHLPAEEMQYGEQAGVIAQGDFNDPDKFICPAADPNLVSDSAAVQQAMILLQRVPTGGYDPDAVEVRFLQAARVKDWQQVFLGRQKIPPPPNPKIAVEGMKQQGHEKRDAAKLKQMLIESMVDNERTQAEITLMEAQAEQIVHAIGADAAALDIDRFESMLNATSEMHKARQGYLTILQQSLASQQQQQPGASGT
jgi:chaperonin GroES